MTEQMKEQMIAYLQEMVYEYMDHRIFDGYFAPVTQATHDRLLACKKMVETLIGEHIECDAYWIVRVGKGRFI